MPSSLDFIIREIGFFFKPLGEIASEPFAPEDINIFNDAGDIDAINPFIYEISNQIHDFIGSAKIDLGTMPSNLVQLTEAIEEFGKVWKEVAPQVASSSPDAETLIIEMQKVISSIQDIEQLNLNGESDTPAEILNKIFDRLSILYLDQRRPGILALFKLIGVVVINQDGSLIFNKRNIVSALKNPITAIGETHGWGTELFNHQGLLAILNDMAVGLGLQPELLPAPPHRFGGLTPSISVVTDLILDPTDALGLMPTEALALGEILKLSLGAVNGHVNGLDIGIAFFGLPQIDILQPGIAATLYGAISSGAEFSIDGGWKMQLNGNMQGSVKNALVIRPGSTSMEDAEGLPQAAFETRLTLSSPDRADNSIRIIDFPGLGFAEFKQFDIVLEVSGTTAEPILDTSVRFSDMTVALMSGSTDGFLKEVIPENGISVMLDINVGYHSRDGFYIGNESGLSTQFTPISKSWDKFGLSLIELDVIPRSESIEFGLGFSGSLTLGPVTIMIEKVGMSTALGFKKGRQSEPILTPNKFTVPLVPPYQVELLFGLQPPQRLGLSIDTGAVTGGGYLSLNPEKGEYSGALQLEFGKIGLNAIGILNTKMANGTEGYSLLLIITAEFTPAIQLGFGFNLSKVGGLFGAHRNVVVEVMRDGLRSDSLGNILFPHDPVNNAPSIISNLSSIFPVQQNRFVFGPMASITWGTPKILTIELGILLEMPSPLRLIILGRIRMALPTEDAALVKINLDILGDINFGEKSISVDATLFDSRLASFALSGDMAMRMNYGDKPMFALSIGGMHPAFNKPPAFPSLDRLAISLSSGNNPRMRLEAYVALTSNTAQFGARLDLYAESGRYNVSGTLGFDALFQFSPFYFVVDVYGTVALKRRSRYIMGLVVALTLSGPNPWRAKGKATIKILCFKGSISFDMTIGQKKPEALPSADIWPILRNALESDNNWSAQLPKEGHAFVVFKEESSDKVHPLGTIEFRQQIVPFNLEVQKFGNATPSKHNLFSIEEVKSGDVAAEFSNTKEYFAPAQFLELSEKDKLSRPSFELFTAGARLKSGAVMSENSVDKKLKYNNIIVDNERDLPSIDFKLFSRFQSILNRNKVALRTGAQRSGFERYKSPSMGITMKDKAYKITDKNTMELIKDGFSSYAETVQHMNNQESRHNLQVVDLNEI